MTIARITNLDLSLNVTGAQLLPAGWEELYRRELAAISEGFCPVHEIPLEPDHLDGPRIIGHCTPCRRYWGVNLATQECGWWIDYHVPTGLPRLDLPDYMNWQPES